MELRKKVFEASQGQLACLVRVDPYHSADCCGQEAVEIDSAEKVEENERGNAAEVHFGIVEGSRDHQVDGIAVVVQMVGYWDIEEAYLESRTPVADYVVVLVAEGSLVAAARTVRAVGRKAVDKKGKHHYQEEHRTASAVAGSLGNLQAAYKVSKQS